MPMRRRLFLASFALALLLGAGAGRSETTLQATSAATLILWGGRILTLTAQDNGEAPTAVAVADGRVLYVGDDQGALALRSDATEVVNLAGATVIPGFIDSHGHFTGVGQAKLGLDLMNVNNWDAVVQMVAAAARARPWTRSAWWAPLR